MNIQTEQHAPSIQGSFTTIWEFMAQVNELYTVDAENMLALLTLARSARVNMDVMIRILETKTGQVQP